MAANSPNAVTASETHGLVLEKVATQKSLHDEWWPLLKEIFPDKDDQEPLRQLRERLRDTERNTFYILRDPKDGNKAVGIELRQVDPNIPGSMYVPWAGVTEPYRNKGIYPQMSAICDQQMKEVGAKYVLFEVEDPKRIHVAYPDEKPEVVARMTESRINFWRRATGSLIVRDPEIDYVRPASSDDRKVQGYDLMAVRVLDPADPMWKGVFNEDRTAISKDAYRRFYMEMTRLQYGDKPEAELRRELPAVDQMLTTLDQSKKQWLALETSGLRPNLHEKYDARVDAAQRAPSGRAGRRYKALPQATSQQSGNPVLDAAHAKSKAALGEQQPGKPGQPAPGARPSFKKAL